MSRPGVTEALFSAEAVLRNAAENYASVVNSVVRPAKVLNEARNELRRAARAYAAIVQQVEG